MGRSRPDPDQGPARTERAGGLARIKALSGLLKGLMRMDGRPSPGRPR